MAKKTESNPDALSRQPQFTGTNLPVKAPNDKTTCDEPGYLFWKIQSQLAKLTNRLREEKKIILQDPKAKPNKPIKDSN